MVFTMKANLLNVSIEELNCNELRVLAKESNIKVLGEAKESLEVKQGVSGLVHVLNHMKNNKPEEVKEPVLIGSIFDKPIITNDKEEEVEMNKEGEVRVPCKGDVLYLYNTKNGLFYKILEVKEATKTKKIVYTLESELGKKEYFPKEVAVKLFRSVTPSQVKRGMKNRKENPGKYAPKGSPLQESKVMSDCTCGRCGEKVSKNTVEFLNRVASKKAKTKVQAKVYYCYKCQHDLNLESKLRKDGKTVKDYKEVYTKATNKNER